MSLNFEKLQKAVEIIRKERRCNWGYMLTCGCGMLHDLYYQCKYHHEGMLELAKFLHSDTPERNIFIKEVYGIKLVV